MPRISLLSQDTINKIAAGEVIEQPSCILRELLDNALDAKANQITVRVGYDNFFLEVEDNGCGIPADEILLAFTKHATSKITSFDEIYTTPTLGFRGEALASIASVSEVLMETTVNGKSADGGIQYQIRGGKEIFKKTIARESGTRIRISDLFFNTPVRRKFFAPAAPTIASTKDHGENGLQLRNVDKHNLKREMIRHLLATDGVAFQYWVEDNKTNPPHKAKLEINIPAQSSLLDKILIFFKSNAYGEYLAKSLLAVEQVTGNMEVRGYITNPSIREHRSDKQFFIVNGRTIKEPLLLKAVSLAYLHVIPRGSHPMIFLRINFKPTGEVDPNVHPRKEQVKFKHKENFFNQIMRVMKDTLQKSFTSSALNNAPETAAELTTAYSPPVFPTRQHDLKEEKFVFKDVADDPYHINHINSPEHLGGNFETPILTPNPSNVSNIFEKSVQVLGQIAKAFIVFAIGEDLFIVDQHAAHERINFDRLLNNIKSQPQINTQMLLIPLLIERSSDDKDTILAASSALAKLGFIIEDFGDNLLRFVEVPTYIPEGKIEAVVNSVLNGVLRRSNVGDLTEEEFLGDSVARMACRMSIMVGDPLSKSAMEDLIHTLYKKGYVYTCPHGRPFVKKISLGEMKLFFDRGRHINGELEN